MNAVLFIASVVGLAAYVCRIDSLSWRKHRASVIVLHLAGAGCCAWALTQAAEGLATVGCALALAMAGCWLWVSWFNWRYGPPRHTERATGRI